MGLFAKRGPGGLGHGFKVRAGVAPSEKQHGVELQSLVARLREGVKKRRGREEVFFLKA